MALLRFHRGDLETSLETTVIVKNEDELRRYITWNYPEYLSYDFTLEILPYPDDKLNFDKRIGWYTHMVRIIIEEDVFIIGFLSEPL